MLILAALLATTIPAPAPRIDVKPAILRVLKQLEPQIKLCGHKGKGPREATLSFTIDVTGAARQVSIDLNDSAAACVTQLIVDATWPVDVEPHRVNVPIRLVRHATKTSRCDAVDPLMEPHCSYRPEPFSKQAVLKAVKRALPSIRGCADDSSPDLVKASWYVATDGRPDSVVIDGAIADTPVGRCIAAQVGLMTFPKPDEPVKVSFPLKLR